jgi:hypothetical protein
MSRKIIAAEKLYWKKDRIIKGAIHSFSISFEREDADFDSDDLFWV